ncbi:MAG: ornithine carbamoyltransferase [Desulfovibrio sp.]|nr:ornithine carbamoyltransferase [Desulfovibrio sp.]
MKSALSIREMGEKACWTLVQQALGIPDAKMPSDHMSQRVALLLFARASLPERLCVTAAVRQMGGSTIYQGVQSGSSDGWRAEVRSFQSHLFPVLGYFLDCLYVYGFPSVAQTRTGIDDPSFPIINAGCDDGHPAHALADMACMLRVCKGDISGVKAAWIGSANGTLHSLIEAKPWFPFSLSVSLPPEDADAAAIRELDRELNAGVQFEETPVKAVTGSRFVFAGRRPDLETPENEAWSLTDGLLAKADKDARILLSATPLRAIPVASSLLAGKRSLLVRQAEYRLCVHKRILHWVFDRQD